MSIFVLEIKSVMYINDSAHFKGTVENTLFKITVYKHLNAASLQIKCRQAAQSSARMGANLDISQVTFVGSTKE